jgi:uncharacterized protein (UPF0332 family)
VRERIRALLARSGTELEAARVLASAGFADQAVSRAYYGAFYAAEAALLAVDETRSKHSGVIAAFGRVVVREGGFDAGLGGELRRLFELRNAADYSWLDAPNPEADDPIAVAKRFVAGVESWIADRQGRGLPS